MYYVHKISFWFAFQRLDGYFKVRVQYISKCQNASRVQGPIGQVPPFILINSSEGSLFIALTKYILSHSVDCFTDWATAMIGKADRDLTLIYHSRGPIYETSAQSTKSTGTLNVLHYLLKMHGAMAVV